MLEDLPVAAHWAWLILAAVLGAVEIVMPGFFMIWLGLAAAVVGIVTALTGIDLPLQLGLFALGGVGAVYAGRRWFGQGEIESADPKLNDRSARLVGEIVTAVEPVDALGGKVKVGDSVWLARGVKAAVGTRLRVVSVESGVLVVEAA